MRFPIGAMSAGDILDRALRLLLARLPLFYAIDLIVLSPVLVLVVAAPELTINIPGVLLPGLLQVVLAPIGAAAVLRVIMCEFLDQPVGLGDALRFALTRFLPLLAASILVALLIVAGLFLCVIPGVFAAILFIFTPQAVVLEGLGPAEAMNRSSRLTEGFRGRVFAILVLVYLIGIALSAAVSLPLQMLLPYYDLQDVVVTPGAFPHIPVKNYTNYLINVLAQQLVGILAQTFMAVCITLLYLDLRIRKEGYDLELALGPQTPPPDAVDRWEGPDPTREG
jgi:hypothetical protein